MLISEIPLFEVFFRETWQIVWVRRLIFVQIRLAETGQRPAEETAISSPSDLLWFAGVDHPEWSWMINITGTSMFYLYYIYIYLFIYLQYRDFGYKLEHVFIQNNKLAPVSKSHNSLKCLTQTYSLWFCPFQSTFIFKEHKTQIRLLFRVQRCSKTW